MLPVQLNSEMVTCELEVAQNWHVCNALLKSACDPLCELRSLRDNATLNPPRSLQTKSQGASNLI